MSKIAAKCTGTFLSLCLLLVTGCAPRSEQDASSNISSDVSGVATSNQMAENTVNNATDYMGEANDSSSEESGTTKSSSKMISANDKTTQTTSGKYVVNGPEDLKLNGSKLKIANCWDPSTTEAKNLVSRFKKYCNGNIEYVTLVYNDALRKLATLILSGDSPDVYYLRPLDFPAIMYADVLQPLDSKIKFSDAAFKSAINDWNQYKWDNKYYIMGSANVSNMLWFNKQLLKENGITKDPIQLVKENKWDWNAMLDIAKKTTDIQSGIYGFGDATGTLVNQLIAGYGEDIVKIEKTEIKNNLSSANVSKAVNFYGELYSKFKVMSTQGETARNLFSSGRLAMLYDGHWIGSFEPFKTMNQSGDIIFTHFPRAPGNNEYRYAGETCGYAMPKGAKNIKAACAFLTMNYYVADKSDEIADWHKAVGHTAEETKYVDEANSFNNVLTYSLGIDSIGAFGLAMGKVMLGTPWSTLIQETSPKVDLGIQKFMQRNEKK